VQLERSGTREEKDLPTGSEVSLTRAFGLDDHLDGLTQRGNLVGNNIPDNIQIHAEEIVYKSISHTRQSTASYHRYTLGSLADDFQAAHECPLNRLIGHKLFFCDRRHALTQVSCLVEDVTQVLKG
jgi:hypothetical protein